MYCRSHEERVFGVQRCQVTHTYRTYTVCDSSIQTAKVRPAIGVLYRVTPSCGTAGGMGCLASPN
uniref:Uncharacterized protein n=1 Tax=Anguilla anguilla TaxID=7936 RepID=A0A0E9SJG1_ANGAN